METAKGQSITKKTSSGIKDLAITAVFTALILVFTAFVNIRLPFGGNGGLIHLGNIPLFIVAIIFGKKSGAIAGAIGMGLFDLLSGWTLWAPFTFVIVGLMGFTVGKITEKDNHQNLFWYITSIISACAIKIVGYYFAEVILYHNWLVPFASIPGNIVQVTVAGIATVLIVGQLRKIAIKVNLI